MPPELIHGVLADLVRFIRGRVIDEDDRWDAAKGRGGIAMRDRWFAMEFTLVRSVAVRKSRLVENQ